MKAYVIALIACGSLTATILLLLCLCNKGRRKEQRYQSQPVITAPRPVLPQSYRDVDKAEKRNTSGLRDGGMVVLGATAALAVTAATTAVVSEMSNGGSGGGGDGADSGGGDGDDGGGGCGGCGGGCGGCGGGCGD